VNASVRSTRVAGALRFVFFPLPSTLRLLRHLLSQCPLLPFYRFPLPRICSLSSFSRLQLSPLLPIALHPNPLSILYPPPFPAPGPCLPHTRPTNHPLPVLHLRPQPCPALPFLRSDPHPLHQPTHLPPRLRTLRATRETPRLPRQHYHIADMYNHRALDVCGDWAGVGGCEGCPSAGEGFECVGGVGTEEVAEARGGRLAVLAD